MPSAQVRSFASQALKLITITRSVNDAYLPEKLWPNIEWYLFCAIRRTFESIGSPVQRKLNFHYQEVSHHKGAAPGEDHIIGPGFLLCCAVSFFHIRIRIPYQSIFSGLPGEYYCIHCPGHGCPGKIVAGFLGKQGKYHIQVLIAHHAPDYMEPLPWNLFKLFNHCGYSV